MIKNRKLRCAVLVASSFVLVSGAAAAGERNPSKNTPNLEYGKVLKIRLPYGLCEFERVVPAAVVDKLATRRDYKRLVEYMLVNCPDLALPLADTVTASISTSDGGDEDGGGGSSGRGDDNSGRGDDKSGRGDDNSGRGDDKSGRGDDTSGGDDGNNGHGNDADGVDESNPGNSR
jgi:hypothetical protein